MKKLGGILILFWFPFQFLSHSISFDNSEIATFAYYFGCCIFNLGFASILYGLRDKIYIYRFNKKRTTRLIIVLIIYFSWCLIVEFLILFGLGAADTAIFTNIDMGIISTGIIWAIFV